ncbi:RDD family protein [Roseateles chitosanitabidus]|uniref:RDD family protein n=1 Tax=Roseateles chitosanitabidus TaxID=65048 RepID=UPI00083186D1|nr:RDD family protein [Roseateles chitosanitabidus]
MSNQSAGLAPRALAMVIDGVLMASLSALLMWATYGQPIAKWDDLRPGSIVINWLLPLIACVVFWSWQGATPGKLFVGIKVVDARTGRRPSPLQALLRWIGYLVSAIPLFAGFLWARVDAEGRAWHDRIARTAVLRSRPAPADGQGLLVDYIGSHWRGEQGLARSYWLNHVLLMTPLVAGVYGLMTWIATKGDGLQGGAIAILIGWPLVLVLETWGVVGAWRAVRGYRDDEGSAFIGFLARVLLMLSAAQILASLCLGLIPQFGNYWKMARGIDPIGQVRLELSADGRTMQLNGPIGMGDARRLGALLDTAPAVRMFELASPGGRVVEAERIVELVRERGGSTRAIGNCQSACTLVFLAGAKRQLMPGAQLGFHRASTGTFNPAFDELANQQLARTYRRMDLPEEFIKQTLSTPPHRMWYPTSDELVRHALIMVPPKTLDVALPEPDKPGVPAPLTDYVNALRASEAWFRLDQRFPGLIDAAAAAMRTARESLAGTPQEVDAAQMAAQSVLAPMVRELLLNGSPDLRRRYLQVVRVQLAAAQTLGAPTCQAWLSGSPAARRLLSAESMAWETSWLIESADDPPQSRTRSLTPTALEMEVVTRTVGATASGAFSRLWTDGRAGAAPVSCERAAQVLDQIQRTPVAPRELAERVALQNPR